ncbi:MAG TPA: hypothetical protein VG944_20130, partial [Fimbriimonas sp.]|nr:hypothetical protein [Fimbriimonas sp.]
MLAWIVYSLGTFLAGLLLALILSFFMGGPTKRAEKPYRLIVCCLILTMGGPFMYTEALTKLYGKPMEHALKVVYDDANIDGPFQYYKVVSYNGKTASAYVVGLEHYGGMDDRPILRVELTKDG